MQFNLIEMDFIMLNVVLMIDVRAFILQRVLCYNITLLLNYLLNQTNRLAI